MRSDSLLHGLSIHLWTPDEVMAHLEATFGAAVDQRPDLMEPYMIRMNEEDEATRRAIMREALAATFARRHPSKAARLAQRLSSGAA
jgi:hypothetical protein